VAASDGVAVFASALVGVHDFLNAPAVPFAMGLEDVSKFPDLLKAPARRGWSGADLSKVAGENFLRGLDEADAVAKTAQNVGRE